MHFVFLNERNITISLSVTQLKCTVVHYANLNSNSTNKPYCTCRAEYVILFFSISYLCLFSRGFRQKRYQKTIIFQCKFPKFISRCSILQNIRMSNLVILKWWSFKYKVKFEKKPISFNSKIGIFEKFLKDCTKKVLRIYKSIAIENTQRSSFNSQ